MPPLDKLMSVMRIKTEGERGKDRGWKEKRREKGEKQSDVALPSLWQ